LSFFDRLLTNGVGFGPERGEASQYAGCDIHSLGRVAAHATTTPAAFEFGCTAESRLKIVDAIEACQIDHGPVDPVLYSVRQVVREVPLVTLRQSQMPLSAPAIPKRVYEDITTNNFVRQPA